MAQAMVFKLSPDGTKKIYETTLGGSVQADAAAIAVDSAGAVYVGGTTSSVDFPLVNPLQKHARRASALEEQRWRNDVDASGRSALRASADAGGGPIHAQHALPGYAGTWVSSRAWTAA